MATLSGDRDSSCSPFSTLPPALLARVLQHVPQQQRLACCALVSRDWAAAAAAGTLSIKRTSLDSSKCESIGAWLTKHGGQLESMQLSVHFYGPGPQYPQLQLPCSKLQQLTALRLSWLHVQLPASDNSTTSIVTSSSSTPSQHMPRLQDLHVERCTFDSEPAQLQLGPSSVTAEDSGSPPAPAAPHRSDSGPSEAQSQSTSPAAPDMSSQWDLPQLQRLHLAQVMDGEDWLAEVLPPSITALTLNFITSWQVSLPCNLQQLRGLQELTLHFGGFCADVLASLSQLLALELHGCRLLPDAAGVDNASVLLAAVAGMQELRRLVIEDSSSLTSAQPSSCSALTASSHLTHLKIDSAQALPAAAPQHMFPAGMQRPQLQNLSFSCWVPEYGFPALPFMTGAELAALVSACPALTSLDVAGALQPGESCNALLQLPPTCRKLRVGGEAFGDSALATVVQLTQLTKLGWIGSRSLTDAGLYQLTALQGLKNLLLAKNNGLSKGLVCKEFGHMVWDLSLRADDKPVWRQLHDRVRAAHSSNAWFALLDQRQEENARLQQALAAQRQEIQRLRQAGAQQQQQEIQRLQESCAQTADPAAAAAAPLE